MQKTCTTISIVHLICVSLATLASSFVIESIIFSGAVCILIALVGLIYSIIGKRFWLSAAFLTTILIGAFFVVYELIFLGFGGPEKAALPLCILFIAVQAFSISVTVIDLRYSSKTNSGSSAQISLKQLLIASGIFAFSFGIMENFPTQLVPHISKWSVAFQHTWLVSLTLAMFFLTISGLIVIRKNTNLSNTSQMVA